MVSRDIQTLYQMGSKRCVVVYFSVRCSLIIFMLPRFKLTLIAEILWGYSSRSRRLDFTLCCILLRGWHYLVLGWPTSTTNGWPYASKPARVVNENDDDDEDELSSPSPRPLWACFFFFFHVYCLQLRRSRRLPVTIIIIKTELREDRDTSRLEPLVEVSFFILPFTTRLPLWNRNLEDNLPVANTIDIAKTEPMESRDTSRLEPQLEVSFIISFYD